MDDWVRITVRIRVRWTRWTVGLTRRRRNLRTSLMLTGVLLICILEEVILGDGIAREVHLTIKWLFYRENRDNNGLFLRFSSCQRFIQRMSYVV
ncbi:uncharacterized protein LOC111907473 isoform X6 [Lactuca sativa]|uniref:uncharacterized protein LOC111907473 isoform X6 n=1 Tax=Lactuca sativa TaxID=4236 RepID=UPI001C68ABCB|nr:uncharacterized protein LOC111907473 isoform X6 [Lactuca sativa]